LNNVYLNRFNREVRGMEEERMGDKRAGKGA
jgi:hypothetical protein